MAAFFLSLCLYPTCSFCIWVHIRLCAFVVPADHKLILTRSPALIILAHFLSDAVTISQTGHISCELRKAQTIRHLSPVTLSTVSPPSCFSRSSSYEPLKRKLVNYNNSTYILKLLKNGL